jgi:ABC-type branched-subunit amino acid transport system substrate-binding protein
MKKKLILITTLAVLAIAVVFFLQKGGKQANDKPNVYALLTLTGATSEIGKMTQKVMTMYMEANKDCSFNLHFVDSESSPEKAITALNQTLIGEKSPIVISGGTYISKATIPFVDSKHGFTIAIATVPIENNQIKACRTFQRISNGIVDVMTPLLDYTKQQKRSILIIYSNDEFGIATKNYFSGEMIKHENTKISSLPFSLTESNVREIAMKAVASESSTILITGTAAPAYTNIIRELKTQNYKGEIIADVSFSHPFVYKNLGELAEDVIFVCTKSDFSNQNSDNAIEFATLCKKNNLPSYYITVHAFDALSLIDILVKNNKELSQKTFVDLSKFNGCAGPVDFLPNGNCNYSFTLAKISKNKIIQLENGK